MYAFLVVSLPTLVPEFAGNDYLIPFAFAGMALAVVIVVYVIAIVLAQRKQVALYLRHFRMSQAAHNMASVLRVRFNGQCRLVTLDDSTFRPMDTGRGYKSLRFVIVLAILAIVGALVAIAVYSLIKFTPTIGGIVWLTISESLFIILPFVLGSAWLFTLLLGALIVHLRRIKSRSHLVATDETSLAKVARCVFELTGYPRSAIFAAPQATVVKVTDASWKTTVETLAAEVSAIIVDVTTVTSNVAWELEFLKAQHPHLPVIHIAEASAHDPTGLPPGTTVLLYSYDRSGVAKLRESLQNFLNNSSNTPRTAISGVEIFKQAVKTVLFYFVVLTVLSFSISVIGYELQRTGIPARLFKPPV
jgi:hypothetical protein